jgi:hypothetical protein
METPAAGDRVSVVLGSRTLDGLVFDTPSRTKVVVAVVDPGRGPMFQTVHPDALSPREPEGPQDAALRSLVRRTAPPTHSSARGGAAGRKGAAGFTRPATHRPTGR